MLQYHSQERSYLPHVSLLELHRKKAVLNQQDFWSLIHLLLPFFQQVFLQDVLQETVHTLYQTVIVLPLIHLQDEVERRQDIPVLPVFELMMLVLMNYPFFKFLFLLSIRFV